MCSCPLCGCGKTIERLQTVGAVYEKHNFFTKQLVDAGVPLELAVKEACPMEHVISEEGILKLKSYLER